MELVNALPFILPWFLLSLIHITLSLTPAPASPPMSPLTNSNNNNQQEPGSPIMQSGSATNPIANNIHGNTVYQPQPQPQTAYQPTGYQPQENYVPHATFPYADSFPNPGGYDGYLVPAGPIGYSNNGVQQGEYGSSGSTSLMPTAQNVLVAALRLFAKVGLFLLGGVALLVVGGIFTTAVCSLTPICTITFSGLRGGIDQETVRALMTPDKIATAANFVHDALGKYQRLQRSINY